MADIGWISRHLDDTRRRLIAEVADLNETDLARQPAPEEWSAAQVLEHLAVMEGRLVPHFRGMLAGMVPGAVSLFDRLRCLPPRLVVWRGIRVRAPRVVAPGIPAAKQALLDRLASSRADLLAFVEETRGRDLSSLRLVHPLLGGLDLYGWWELIGHHEERHRRQIALIRRKLRLPRASPGPPS
jgi:hypothetical protein